jgi:subtilase family serine protease
MEMSSGVRVSALCAAVILSSLSYAVTPQDRIMTPLSEGPKVALKGNVHGFAKPSNDLGRANSSRPMQGVRLVFRPSPAQQQDLEKSLAELGDRSSPNYHKYLTPKQFGQRYGMSLNDLNKITAWLSSQGFINIKVANGRNEIYFDGTVGQLESAFEIEMHHYLVDGVVHLANAGEPMIPPSLTGAVVNVSGLNDFAPKPRAKATAHLTSYVTGNHFLTPGDFAAIYGVASLYNAGFDGSGQKIAVIGQSSVSTTDLNNFRSAAGLPASTVTMTLVPSTSTSTQCPGDEGESELDLEWSGGVAKGATIIFVYAGLVSGDTGCGSRSNNVWNALDYAVQQQVAPFISTSYGFCESGLGAAFAGPGGSLELLAQQAQRQGQTIVAAAGDAGAADCEPATSQSATTGLAVDAPGSLPEVVSAGGNEFVGDDAGTVTGTAPDTTAGATQYWGPSGTGNDGTVATALGYIPEEGWNDTAASIALGPGHGFSATGGGASIFFSKPIWQTGTGVPNDGKRDVPDISLSASPDHDAYLVCSTDMDPTSCTTVFRDGSTSNGCPCFTGVGGTSASAPTFSAILAIINQYLGHPATTGLAPVNGNLYFIAASTPAAFNDVKSGNNIVPCTQGSTDCPSVAPFQIGFTAGTGYDQVTGLGSVNAFNLAQAMSKEPGFSLVASPTSYQVSQGASVTATVNLTPINGFTGQVTYTCNDTVTESTCTGPTTATANASVSFAITTNAPTARLESPFNRREKIFYASLFPGLIGIVFVAGSRKSSQRGVRFLGLLMVLGFSTMWLGSCGGSSSSSTKDAGTPTGTYNITVTGSATVNGASVSRTANIQLVVVQ